jgi:chemotaxis protein CheZ
MAGPRKIFHIEETAALRPAPHSDDRGAAARHGEILQELGALRAALAAASPSARERSLHDGPRLQVAQLTRIAHELDAVRKDSEEATQKILAAAEDVDQAANNLSAALRGEIAQGLAQDIRDRVIQIFEACNFQDLTSQRVAKVMATINNLEVQITRALDELKRADTGPPVHGPRLEHDRGHASQSEVDALFDGVPTA